MNITGFSIKNKVTIMVLVALMSVYGVISYFTLPKQQDPGFTIRAAVITTLYPGASPYQVEQLVSDPIEKAIQEMPELDFVTSESMPGYSFVTANFLQSYKDMRPIFDKLRRKIDDIDGLPEGLDGPHVNDEYGDVFGSVFALTGDGYSYRELKDVADDIKEYLLLNYENVAKVNLQGIQDQRIYVDYDLSLLQELGISPEQLTSILQNINIISGGGSVRSSTERIPLEPSGNFETIEDLKSTVIQIPDSERIVYLGDIVNIYSGYKDPPSSFTYYNGESSIIISVSLREGGNIINLGQQLLKDLPSIEAQYPYGIELTPVYMESTQVVTAVDSFLGNLMQSILIVVAVMLLFLGLRTGLIVTLLIPTTIMAVMMFMDVFSITINQISLAALIISLGLLVDNAIVISESILVKRQAGASAIDAAVSSGKELMVPLLTSSLTTAAAFLPIFLAENAVGEYTADIFKVVTIALLSSWCIGITFIPLMTTIFMRVKQTEGESFDSSMYRIYNGLLMWSVRNRLLFLLLLGAVFMSALWALRFVPQVFIPDKTDPIITGTISMPRGTSIESMVDVMEDLQGYIQDELKKPKQDAELDDTDSDSDPLVVKASIKDWAVWVGEGTPRYALSVDPGASLANQANLLLNATDYRKIPAIVDALKAYALPKYPDIDIQLRKLANGVPIIYPIEVRVSGEDLTQLYQIVDRIKENMLNTEGVTGVTDNWGVKTKKIVVDVSQERARRSGVTNNDIAVSLKSGLTGIEMTQFRDGNTLIPVILRSAETDRQDIEKLENTPVYSQATGQTVPLGQVADVNLSFQPNDYIRYDRRRTITVQVSLAGNVTATDALKNILPWLEPEAESWPRGYAYELGGEFETSGDANAAIAAKLPLAGMLILLLLVAQFNSVRKPIMIFMTIPLGLVGVVYGLLIGQSIFGFFTILGLVSLSGIVINNAIVLLDRINIEITENGLSDDKAVISACLQRLRPILLTTATTVGGMLPLWISHDPMFETMAISIIFGLMFATVITLLFIPVLYSLLFRVRFD